MLLCGAGPEVSATTLAASVPGIVGVSLNDVRPDSFKSFFKWLDQDVSNRRLS